MRLSRLYQFLFAIWIAKFEGYFDPPSRARRNNNPGNLKGWDPALPKDPAGFDRFPTVRDGWSALFRQIKLNFNRRLTVREFFEGKAFVYPGYDATNPTAYARFISGKTGVPLDNVPILDHISRVSREFSGELT